MKTKNKPIDLTEKRRERRSKSNSSRKEPQKVDRFASGLDEITFDIVIWHKLSNLFDGVYVLQVQNDLPTLSEELNPNVPMVVVTFDELVNLFGHKEANSMAEMCDELDFESQRKFAMRALRICGAKDVHPALEEGLRKDGIPLDLLKPKRSI